MFLKMLVAQKKYAKELKYKMQILCKIIAKKLDKTKII